MFSINLFSSIRYEAERTAVHTSDTTEGCPFRNFALSPTLIHFSLLFSTRAQDSSRMLSFLTYCGHINVCCCMYCVCNIITFFLSLTVFAVGSIQVSCYRILNCLYSLGTSSSIFKEGYYIYTVYVYVKNGP